MASIRSILSRILGRTTLGAVLVSSEIDDTTLAALTNGDLTPPFPHDAPAGSTCGIGWHVRRSTLAEAFAVMTRTKREKGRVWFRIDKRSERGISPLTPSVTGDLFRFGEVLPDGTVSYVAPWLCDACGRAIRAA